MTFALTLSTTALALALTGCGPEDEGGSSPVEAAPSAPTRAASASDHNKHDTMFVQRMIPHHQQAVEMSTMMLEKKDIDPRVTALAVRIKDAQAPEIATMTLWLQLWGEPDSHESGGNHLAGHVRGGHDEPGMAGMAGMAGMSGMMTSEQMTELGAASGKDAARMFLRQMIAHHEGAVTMAGMATAAGSNGEVVALARAITSAQQAEIREMNDLEATL